MITHQLPPKAAQVGGAPIRRLLPQRTLRKVGPWVFLDHFGPMATVGSRDHDVLPHPHIGLSTVTFLLEGRVEHRDSTGGHAVVQPGEVHWMRAGRGIVHSERCPADELGQPRRVHGLQLWCAHPDGEEDQDPRFDSWTALPRLDVEGVPVRLLAGDGWGAASPVDVTSPLVYAIAQLKAGQTLALPDHAERCVYPLDGAIGVDGQAGSAGHLLVVDADARAITATTDAHVVVLGGAPIGPRHIWWNFVHSDPQRIREQAQRWEQGGFPPVVGEPV